MRSLAIILLAVVGAISYGIVHDQVTARICVEYFTIGHPRVIASEDPTMLAFTWGVLATWWVGAALGGLLAIAARLGTWPLLTARDLVRPVFVLLVVMGVASLAAGLLGHHLAESGQVVLLEPFASRLPADKHVPFLTDLLAHNAAYLFGGLGGLLLALRTVFVRRRLANAETLPTSGKS